MFELVRREIARAGYEGMLGAGVVITGGTSLLEGMPDAAEHVLNLPARRGAPSGIGGLRDIVGNPMHATGVGLLAACAAAYGGDGHRRSQKRRTDRAKMFGSNEVVDVRVF